MQVTGLHEPAGRVLCEEIEALAPGGFEVDGHELIPLSVVARRADELAS